MRPRAFTHRGSIEVVAFVVDDALGRKRALDLWEPGVIVQRVAFGHLVRLPRARRVNAERAPATPLVALRSGKVLSSAPLADDELKTFDDGSVVVVRAGAASALAIESDPIDLSTWIELDAWSTAKVTSLGDPPPAALQVFAAPPPARALFANVVGAPPAQHAAIVAALTKEGHETTVRPSTVVRLAMLAARFLSSVRDSASKRTGRSLAAVPSTPRGPGLLDRMITRLNDLVARMLVATRLAQLVGRRQAAYLDKLFSMFERGELDEALRHAIPLGGGSGESRQMLGVPSARRDLKIQVQRHGGASSAIGLGDDLFAQLRRKYRAAFQRLVEQDRIDEAAFVLVELLREDEEAVAFLERHGRTELAAELADARGMAPDLRVRQWFVARDYARAIAIARAHNAFAGAIQRLERANQYDPASALRMLWADSLADAGDYQAAVAAIWPLDAARTIAMRWIDLGIELGGAAGAKMLGRKIALTPEGSDEILDRVHRILESDDPEAPYVRRAFGSSLAAESPTPFGKAVARATTRALYDDLEHDDGGLQGVVRQVIDYADDAALRADRPTWPTHERPPTASVRTLSRFDGGSLAVRDAAILPDGRTLVALGELGVRVLSRAGRTVAQFDQPADHLVLSDRGDRAIAVSRRGHVSRLARIDLVQRRSEAWCEARLACFARDFDGSRWIAGEEGENTATTLLVDALADSLRALRDLKTIPPISIARSTAGFAVLAAEFFGAPERYTYDASAQLRTRAEVPATDRQGLWAIASDGSYAALLMPADDQPVIALHVANDRTIPIGEPGELPLQVVLNPSFIVAVVGGPQGLRVIACSKPSLTVAREVRLEGATAGGARLQENFLVAWDDRGRVFAIDISSGRTQRDLRV